MSNFVSNSDANALMSEIGKKKLTVTDVMPLAASAANEGIPYLYLGTTTQDFTNGSIYECQEVTPATDPKTYEWVEKYQSNVDLTYYKRIWGGTEAGWDQLTDEQKANYEYMFFDGDDNYYLPVVDAVTKDDMHPVTSNAVAEEVEDLDAEIADIVNVYGAKNIIPYPYYWDSRTYRGINFTNNGDGTITANGTQDGTAGTVSGFRVTGDTYATAIKLLPGKYILTGCPEGGSDSTHRLALRIYSSDGTSTGYVTDYGDGAVVNISAAQSEANRFGLFCDIMKNVHVDNMVFSPMLRLASIKDDTYEPYSMTNKELTDAAIYSTSEINTHKKWIDGKDIYRKVITGTTGTTGQDSNVGNLSSNFAELISVTGHLQQPTVQIPCNFVRSDLTTPLYFSPLVSTSSGNVGDVQLRYTANTYSSLPFKLVFEYTKTS